MEMRFNNGKCTAYMPDGTLFKFSISRRKGAKPKYELRISYQPRGGRVRKYRQQPATFCTQQGASQAAKAFVRNAQFTFV